MQTDAATLRARETKPARADWGATLREHRVDSHGADKGAFSGHVRAADDHDAQLAAEIYVVRDGAIRRNQWMAEALASSAVRLREFGKSIVGMFVGVACQIGQSFELA